MTNIDIDAPGTKAARRGMVFVPGRSFRMGSDKHYPEEAPAHLVKVDGFWIDVHTVTNSQFERFVKATGYVTVAERLLDPDQFPGAKPTLLKPGSMVFKGSRCPVDLRDISQWWAYVPGANWRHPKGPGSSLDGLENHPVVHVCFEDVESYATWAGKALPTEAEWEFAARGGLEAAEFVWGSEFTPNGKHMANTWQGEFPWRDLGIDGFAGTSPVGSFPANGYGLFDMAGNVWNWTCDWYSAHHPADAAKPCCVPVNPRGATQEHSYSPSQQQSRIPRKVLKGGSFLCAPGYCRRYRPAARHAQMVDTGMSHIGFRCVIREGTTHD